MKRIAVFIVFILYFVASTGAIVHYHYCMGEIADSSIWGASEKKCGKCGMEKEQNEDNGCCKDERQWIKIEDDQTLKSAQPEIPKLESEAIRLVFINNTLFASESVASSSENKAPLRSCETATYLLNCVFRI